MFKFLKRLRSSKQESTSQAEPELVAEPPVVAEQAASPVIESPVKPLEPAEVALPEPEVHAEAAEPEPEP